MDEATLKRRAAEAAVETVEDGDVVGLGTGSTAAAAIEALGERVDDGLDVEAVATSHQAREVALSAGLPLVELDQVAAVDVAIDGADQVVLDAGSAGGDGSGPTGSTDRPVLVKGGGGAHAREKLVDSAAETFLVIVDPSKLSDVLDEPVPVEVLPAARTVVADAVRDLGGEPELRDAAEKSGPVVTDNGNLLVDCDFGSIDDPGGLAAHLSALPGVLEHGLFVDVADAVYVGREDGVDVLGSV